MHEWHQLWQLWDVGCSGGGRDVSGSPLPTQAAGCGAAGVRSSRGAGGVGSCGGRVSDCSLREDLAAVFGGALALSGLWRVSAERVFDGAHRGVQLAGFKQLPRIWGAWGLPPWLSCGCPCARVAGGWPPCAACELPAPRGLFPTLSPQSGEECRRPEGWWWWWWHVWSL